MIFDEALQYIRCNPETPRELLSCKFWPAYEKIKAFREQTQIPRSEQSLQAKAESNLRSALKNHAAELEEYIGFINTLLRDLKDYQTLPKYTLRRLTAVEMNGNVSKQGLMRFRSELENLRRSLGENYLERIEQRVMDIRSEIIIAVENIKGNV